MFVYRNNDSILFTNEEITYEDFEFNYNVPKDGVIKNKRNWSLYRN
ncbi:hypothetical protein Q5M85_04055 [Paraclostridium bifermentans]|nr:hypothetical protein [Paraclostridium bifermentans]